MIRVTIEVSVPQPHGVVEVTNALNLDSLVLLGAIHLVTVEEEDR